MVVDELLAFSTEHVCRLTGLSERQLSYWDTTDFFSPQYADDNRRRVFSRIYSFRDIVALRVLGLLRKTHKVPLQELRKVDAWLRENHESPWANLTFYVSGKRIFFDDPRTGARLGTKPLGQPVFPFEMERVAHEMSSAAKRLQMRDRDEVGKVIRNRYVVHNAPVLAGTRIPTSAVWNLHEAGFGVRAIIREYPRLKKKDVEAAIDFESEHRTRRAG